MYPIFFREIKGVILTDFFDIFSRNLRCNFDEFSDIFREIKGSNFDGIFLTIFLEIKGVILMNFFDGFFFREIGKGLKFCKKTRRHVTTTPSSGKIAVI